MPLDPNYLYFVIGTVILAGLVLIDFGFFGGTLFLNKFFLRGYKIRPKDTVWIEFPHGAEQVSLLEELVSSEGDDGKMYQELYVVTNNGRSEFVKTPLLLEAWTTAGMKLKPFTWDEQYLRQRIHQLEAERQTYFDEIEKLTTSKMDWSMKVARGFGEISRTLRPTLIVQSGAGGKLERVQEDGGAVNAG